MKFLRGIYGLLNEPQSRQTTPSTPPVENFLGEIRILRRNFYQWKLAC